MKRARSYILALDEGTSSARSVVFDQAGRVVASAQQEFAQHFPHPGWVEHDALEIWKAQRASARLALKRAKITAHRVAAVGIANQRETVVVWDRKSGVPIYKAIVWQDRRTGDACERMRAKGAERDVARRTGLRLDPYFTATKLAWILDHVRGARARAERGELLAGTMDTWLAWKLSDGAVHATDPSNASRTLLMDLRTGDWSEPLLRMFRVPRSVLPAIVPTSGVCGTATRAHFGAEIPIAALVGDQQGALFGNQCTRPGMAKCTYGTGCFLLVNTGGKPVASRNRLLTTVAWKLGDAPLQYALEGSVFVGGAAVQWLRDGLGVIRTAPEVNELAAQVPDSGGLVLVPAFTGLGCPYWDATARGALLGITRGATKAHLARATLESIALQVTDLVHAMERDTRRPVRALHVDGGAAASDILMQSQANVLGCKVNRPGALETTAIGAAMLAGLGVGLWKKPPERAQAFARSPKRALKSARRLSRQFKPAMRAADRRAVLAVWHRAVERASHWTKDANTP
ncbi:MAG: glycerol kinase GlpK [Phycisphaerae bacterium]|nr:glycerol kinase GlpK [Phycisphaerae bacterium]